MIQIEFVHYTETKTGTSYHTVSGLKSIKVDPQSIKGIDYHSIESRKARFTFYDNSSFFSTYFLTNWTYIADTKYNIFAIRLSNNGVTDYIGYVKPDNVIYDVKTGMVNISATDILGVLLDLADTDNDYDEGTHNVNTLLQTEITEILSLFDIEYSDTSDNITYELSNLEITYSNIENFLINNTTSGLVGSPLYDCYAYIRNVVYDSENNEFIVKICDYNQIFIEQYEYNTTRKNVYFKIGLDLFIREFRFVEINPVHANPNIYWDYYINSEYGVATSNQTATDNSGNIFNFGNGVNDTILYFSGEMKLDTINIDIEGDSTVITKQRKEMIKILLLILNAGINVDKDGDITIKDKDLIGTGINIDSYTLENKKGFILHSEKDFNSIFNFISGSENLSSALTNYYNNLFKTFKYEYNLSVNSDANLSLGDTITSDGKDMRIVEIDEPYNEDIYYIKAWGE
ncbi:MAG: hypothetical protein H8D22_05495 [Candidatus Cloacimonetes bacterium]|nr:hypothetical protein [Candidatus Cloacimonadota bacterium]